MSDHVFPGVVQNPLFIQFVPIVVDNSSAVDEMYRVQARREYVKSIAGGKPASEAYLSLKDRL